MLLELPPVLHGRRVSASRAAARSPASRRAGAAPCARPSVAAPRAAAQPSIGDGGIRVGPCTSGIRIPTSSTKHQHQSSPGSSERMIGCAARARRARVACRFGESSQQPTCPHSRQMRRCSQTPPVARQSSQPSTDSGQLGDGDRGRGGCRSACAALLGCWCRGSRTWKIVPPGLGVEGQRAVVAVDDDAPRGVEPEAGALADVLGGEERVEDALADRRRGMPGPSSAMSIARAVAVAPRGDRDRPGLAERVDRVVEQVRPHLVELGAVHGQLAAASRS